MEFSAALAASGKISFMRTAEKGALMTMGGGLAVFGSFFFGVGPCNATIPGGILFSLGALSFLIGVILLVVGLIGWFRKTA